MTFPVYLHLFGQAIHPHMVLEVIAYAGGFQLYRVMRKRIAAEPLPIETNLWIIVGAIFGALAGAKLLAWAESPREFVAAIGTPTMFSGKTIAGGLLGGWIGVEIAKKKLGVTRSTGDAFVFPLAFGICMGRIGCFLTGLSDQTHGTPTTLPWAVDFGDGLRHPTQLYEIAFVATLSILLLALRYRLAYTNGQTFRLFMAGYLLFRVGVEFVKPSYKPYIGLSAIQIACFIGAVVSLWQFRRLQATPVVG